MFLEILALAQAATQASPAVGTSTAELDKVTCRRIEQTGSRLGSKKVCMTKAQWQERTRNDQREVEALTKNVRCPNGGSC
jgi:hypothetical protein